jgi:hypothetical protein
MHSNTIFLALIALSFSFTFGTFDSNRAWGDESVVNQTKDAVGDASTSIKKGVRNQKRKIREATGNDTVMKDVKDVLNDADDDISNEANKAKRKLNQK